MPDLSLVCACMRIKLQYLTHGALLPLFTTARKIKPDDTPEWRFAYNTTLTREELEKELGSQKGRREKIQALITRVLTTIQGATNSGPLDIEKYKHCFIRQLNANLFPGRPKVKGLLRWQCPCCNQV